MTAPLEPDRGLIETFVNALFPHAGTEGYISLRAFTEGNNKKFRFTPTALGGGLPFVIGAAEDDARRAAQFPKPVVFCPPTCVFANGKQAREQDVKLGVVLSVELDFDAEEALARLEALIGPATVVVRSGGQWIDNDGVAHDKLHAHWRLTKPAADEKRLAALKEARSLAALITGGDPTNTPVCHPIRWPGSWHRKATPRLCSIVRVDPDREIDLEEALEALTKAAPAQSKGNGKDRPPNPDPQSDVARLVRALAVILNGPKTHWDFFNTIGMAMWRATGGSDAGFAAFDAWASKSSKYDAGTTSDRWEHYFISPPTKLGAGTIFFYAKQADPTWDVPKKDERVDEDKIALEFSALHADDMRFVSEWGRWYKWTGSYWRHETTLQAFDEARVLVRAAPIPTDARTVAAVVTFARADRRQAASPEQWNTNPWLLGTPGGTIDLRTGTMRTARPLDYITKLTAVAPRRMDMPLWNAFLDKVTAGDKKLQAFLQRFAGYSLTGSTKEHALLFLFGTGKNGKSTFLETVARILGDYHQKADMELLNASKFARHSTEIAVLHGARLVTAIETGEERSWDEAKIKALTGGDTLSARFMRKDPFNFVPQFKLLIGGNHKPVVRTLDEAMRRRFMMAPFTVTILEAERDTDLGDKLKAEWPGILAWMIDGCLAWQKVGLAKPKAVLDTTATYLEAQDVLQDFLDTCCAVAKTESDTFAGIWDGWTDYCDDCREPAGTKKAFGQKLQDKGFKPYEDGDGTRCYQGLRCMRENMKKLLAEAALKRANKT